MRKTNKRNRWLALALCLCLLTCVFPLSGMTYAAAEQGCNHVHDTAVCGYTETVEGQPCTFTHAHDDTCGYARAVAAAPCSVEAAHIHDESCGGAPDTGGAAPLPMNTTTTAVGPGQRRLCPVQWKPHISMILQCAVMWRRWRASPVTTSMTRTAAG